MAELGLEISGMSCGHCVGRVSRALQTVPGVTIESVQIGSAKVAFDPALTSAAAITQAVTAAGYEAHVAGGG